MKTLKKGLYFLLFLILVISMLAFPKQALSYAFTGLQLWLNKMIPALLPFMILSGIMISLQVNTTFMSIFSPILGPVFQLGKDCLYVIFIGFLCGFPMGAKTCVQLYLLNRITKDEAEYLLSFCNNIGPIYFFSFVFVTLQIDTGPLSLLSQKIPYILGMYGIPLLYGIFLRYTYYRNRLTRLPLSVSAAALSKEKAPSLIESMDIAIINSLRQIAMLGGYMVLFNMLNLIPFLLPIKNTILIGVSNCLLEITSGIIRITNLNQSGPLLSFCVLTCLVFGGLSCLAQTLSILRETNLSSLKYLFHKIVLTAIASVYYGFLLF